MKQKHDRRRVAGSRIFQQMDPAAFDVDEPPSRGKRPVGPHDERSGVSPPATTRP